MSTTFPEPNDACACRYANVCSSDLISPNPAMISRMGPRDCNEARDHMIASTVTTMTSPTGQARLRPWPRAVSAGLATMAESTVYQLISSRPPAMMSPSVMARNLASEPVGHTGMVSSPDTSTGTERMYPTSAMEGNGLSWWDTSSSQLHATWPAPHDAALAPTRNQPMRARPLCRRPASTQAAAASMGAIDSA